MSPLRIAGEVEAGPLNKWADGIDTTIAGLDRKLNIIRQSQSNTALR